MKTLIIAALLAGTAFAFIQPSQAACSTCQIQTKKASATAGKFDYSISCTDDSSGDEKISKVTAGSDEEAIKMAQSKC